MQTSINLQEPFMYSIIPLIIVIVLTILFTYFSKKIKPIKKNKEKQEIRVIPQRNIKNIPVIKNKYLKQLDDIEYKFTNNKMKIRTAYQNISKIIRMFVFEVTDVTTQNYSLTEIKKLDLPILYELIEEYYEPEFAYKSIGDFNSSINKAKEVIKKWN